jgi:beta-mannanase
MGLYMPDGFIEASRRALEQQLFLERKFHVLSFYVAWGPGNGRPDLEGIEEVLRSGFVPMITWEPWQLPGSGRPEDQPEFSLSSILSGKYDDYIWNWALDLKKLRAPIFFRPMHEMNGNWYPWCGSVNGNKPKECVDAWCHIRSIFRRANNDRLVWVWSPYARSVPDEPDNEIRHHFPGTEEVDWVGLDGYNWGTNKEWSGWQSFRDVFEDGYRRVAQLAPDKPFMIAEVGCAEEGGSKPRWIREAFEALRGRFSRIKIMVWFNINKECDWRIESSQESVTSFRTHMRHWQGNHNPD